MLVSAMGACLAQTPPLPQPAKAAAPAQPAAPVVSQAVPGGPSWGELSAAQQTSLAPLKVIWGSISAAHKRKWLALSPNFHRMSQPEQARLHSRMVEWASLSASQRLEARLNYAQIPSLSSEEKSAQWQAYQALSPEEKKALAAQATPLKAPGTAPAIAGNSKKKLAAVPLTHPETHPAAAVRVAPASHPAASLPAAAPAVAAEGESHAAPMAGASAPASGAHP